jgi:hypothetical protein
MTTKFCLSLIMYKLTIYDPFGEFETSVVTPTGSTDAVWQFIVFVVRLYSYPDDGDGKRCRNMFVINNVQSIYCTEHGLL